MPNFLFMPPFWSDPYLWIHLSGLAVLPLLLEICLLGLAAGEPVAPVWLETFLVAVVGALPIAWMQLKRPFYIYSVVAVTIKTDRLTEDQRRILTLFQARKNPILIGGAALALVAVLRQVYLWSALASDLPFLVHQSHWLGLLVAALAFLAANLFLQVPLSVLGVMLAGQNTFTATAPYAVAEIPANFSIIGLPLNQILPPLEPDPPKPVPEAVTAVSEVAVLEMDASEVEGSDTGDEASWLNEEASELPASNPEVDSTSSDPVGTDLPNSPPTASPDPQVTAEAPAVTEQAQPGQEDTTGG